MILPALHADPGIPNTLVGYLQFAGHSVTLRIIPDDATTDECLDSASRAVAAVQEIDVLAREVAVKDLLPNYNENWRHYSRASDDGSFVDVHDPELSPADFKARLTLTCLEVLGATCYTVFYDDGGLFAGHSVVVTSFDGLLFRESHAEIFG
jgi:hypothetical protein